MTQFPPPQPVYPQPPMQSNQPNWQPQRPASGLAVAGFVCSLIMCIPGLGLLGAIFSFAGLFATGASGKRGRGLAIAGLIIGLVVTGGWIAGGIGWEVVVRSADEPIDQFVTDYNAGKDHAIYDRSSREFKAVASYEKLHDLLNAARSQFGKAVRMDTWGMITTAGFHVGVTNQEMSARMPLKFEKVGTKEVLWNFQRENGEWKLSTILFTDLSYAQTQPQGN